MGCYCNRNGWTSIGKAGRLINETVVKMETECKMCGGDIAVPGDVIQGEIVACPDCGLEFEIQEVNSGNVVLRAAEEVKEDWGE